MPHRRMTANDLTCRSHHDPVNACYRRISPVAAHSGDCLLSEPTAGTQPCRREPLFMPHCGRPLAAKR